MSVLAALVGSAACVFAQPAFDLDVVGDEPLRFGQAVGLVVPDAGPTTSERRALASLARGEVRNSLRGEAPSGPLLIDVDCAARRTVVGIPLGGTQPNDRRYAITYNNAPRGLLTSDSTRIPGLVSIADVAQGKLETLPHRDPVAYLRDLDRRIDANNRWRRPLTFALVAAIAVAALVAPAAAVAAFPAALLANLALGAAGLAGAWALALLAAPFARRRLALLSIGGIAAYAVALVAEPPWVALSPLGPSQNSRFFGVSNLLETLLLVPALAGAELARRRFGWRGFAPVAGLAVVTVAAGALGADAGGGIVLAAAFATLAALAGGRRVAIAVAAAVAIVLALAVVLGPATHVTESLSGGPGTVVRDLSDRVELAWLRATENLLTAIAVGAALTVLVVLVARLPRGPVSVALATGVAVSLVVNDSPLEVALVGAAGYLAVSRWETLSPSVPARRTQPRPGSPAR